LQPGELPEHRVQRGELNKSLVAINPPLNFQLSLKSTYCYWRRTLLAARLPPHLENGFQLDGRAERKACGINRAELLDREFRNFLCCLNLTYVAIDQGQVVGS